MILLVSHSLVNFKNFMDFLHATNNDDVMEKMIVSPTRRTYTYLSLYLYVTILLKLFQIIFFLENLL